MKLDDHDKNTFDFLKNYLADLEHQSSNGLESINSVTNGTPEFKNMVEYWQYISDLQKCLSFFYEEMCYGKISS